MNGNLLHSDVIINCFWIDFASRFFWRRATAKLQRQLRRWRRRRRRLRDQRNARSVANTVREWLETHVAQSQLEMFPIRLSHQQQFKSRDFKSVLNVRASDFRYKCSSNFWFAKNWSRFPAKSLFFHFFFFVIPNQRLSHPWTVIYLRSGLLLFMLRYIKAYFCLTESPVRRAKHTWERKTHKFTILRIPKAEEEEENKINAR